MGNDTAERADKGNRTFVLVVSLLFGLFLGVLAALGYVFHDERPWSEGLLSGLGFFVFGFLVMYLRYARRIAEFLSSVP